MHDLVLLIPVFLFGIIFGSFLNVLIYRLPLELSIVSPPSHCPKCDQPIRFYDNIPILSYLILGGICRHCRATISIRYPLVELSAGILAVIAIYHFGLTIRGFEAAFLSLLFVPIFMIDLDHRIIPNSLDLPWIVVGFAISFIPGAFIGWKESLIGIVVGGGLFALVMWLGGIVFKKEAMGLGDVKLAAMLGAFLGWQNILLILVLSSFLGSVIGVLLIVLSRKKDSSTVVPFGPFLVAAALIAIYFGHAIITIYWNFARGRSA
jgi:leader peptidase (prepilin peptidase) / N-methyltransferase